MLKIGRQQSCGQSVSQQASRQHDTHTPRKPLTYAELVADVLH